jgi:hypothetical protein
MIEDSVLYRTDVTKQESRRNQREDPILGLAIRSTRVTQAACKIGFVHGINYQHIIT